MQQVSWWLGPGRFLIKDWRCAAGFQLGVSVGVVLRLGLGTRPKKRQRGNLRNGGFNPRWSMSGIFGDGPFLGCRYSSAMEHLGIIPKCSGGSPWWMVYNGKSYLNWWFRGTPILGHHQIGERWERSQHLWWLSEQDNLTYLRREIYKRPLRATVHGTAMEVLGGKIVFHT